jgi:hypothetical protein
MERLFDEFDIHGHGCNQLGRPIVEISVDLMAHRRFVAQELLLFRFAGAFQVHLLQFDSLGGELVMEIRER